MVGSLQSTFDIGAAYARSIRRKKTNWSELVLISSAFLGYGVWIYAGGSVDVSATLLCAVGIVAAQRCVHTVIIPPKAGTLQIGHLADTPIGFVRTLFAFTYGRLLGSFPNWVAFGVGWTLLVWGEPGYGNVIMAWAVTIIAALCVALISTVGDELILNLRIGRAGAISILRCLLAGCGVWILVEWERFQIPYIWMALVPVLTALVCTGLLVAASGARSEHSSVRVRIPFGCALRPGGSPVFSAIRCELLRIYREQGRRRTLHIVPLIIAGNLVAAMWLKVGVDSLLAALPIQLVCFALPLLRACADDSRGIRYVLDLPQGVARALLARLAIWVIGALPIIGVVGFCVAAQGGPPSVLSLVAVAANTTCAISYAADRSTRVDNPCSMRESIRLLLVIMSVYIALQLVADLTFHLLWPARYLILVSLIVTPVVLSVFSLARIKDGDRRWFKVVAQIQMG